MIEHWSEADSIAADEEGWDIFCVDYGDEYQIQAVHERDIFVDPDGVALDHQAWEHVVNRANEGSALHQRALSAIAQLDPRELSRIEEYMKRLQHRH